MKPHKHQTLQEAFDLFVREQNALLPDEETLSTITFTDSFKQRMQKLLRRQRQGFFVLFGTVGRRIASIAVAVLVATTVTTVSVEALREPVFQFFAEVYEKFTQVLFEDDSPSPPVTELEKRMPMYIPNGYVMESETHLGFWYKSIYVNKSGNTLRYSQRFKESVEVQADTEDIQYTNVLIGDYQGVMYNNKGFNYVIFSDGKYTYTISSDTIVSELIKIAESIQ